MPNKKHIIKFRDPHAGLPHVVGQPMASLIDYPRKLYSSIIRVIRRKSGTVMDTDTVDDNIGREDFELLRHVLETDIDLLRIGQFHITLMNISVIDLLELLKFSAVIGFSVFTETSSKLIPSVVVEPSAIKDDTRFTSALRSHAEDLLIGVMSLHSKAIAQGISREGLTELIPMGTVTACELAIDAAAIIRAQRLAVCNNRGGERLAAMIKPIYLCVRKLFPLIFSGVGYCSRCKIIEKCN